MAARDVKLVVDIGLSPAWVDYFEEQGFSACHWSDVGDPRAADTEILRWARERCYSVFTHDLDFSRILALTRASGPSVFQVRTEDVLPSGIGEIVTRALNQHGDALQAGALVVVDANSTRARILPI